jgi:hypothetical protein
MNDAVSRLREISKIAVAKYFGQIGATPLFAAFPNSRGAAILVVKKTGGMYEIVSMKQNDFFYAYNLRRLESEGLRQFLKASNYMDLDSDRKNALLAKETGDLMKDIAMFASYIKKLKYYEKVDAKKAAKILTLKESIPVVYIQRYFPEIPFEGDGVSEKVGPFDVSFDHEDKREQKSIEDLIQRTVKAVEAGGFAKYLYGKIYVVDKLKGRTVADYSHASDSIRISTKARMSQDDLRTMIHEIGHRIYIKGGVDAYKIRSKFMEAMKGFELKIDKGTIITDKKSGEQFQFVGIDLYARTKPYKILKVENGVPNPQKSYRCSAFFFSNFSGDFTIKTDWFPTSYSKTNHEEWFCEVLSFALTSGQPQFVDFISEVKK